MKCYYHPDVEAIATCSSCGKAICQDDAVDVANKITCRVCLASDTSLSVSTAKPSQPTNTLAIVSFGFSVLGLLGCCFGILSLFGAVAAITGYLARKQILESQETQQGMQLATIGMILGLVEVSLFIIVLLFFGSVFGLGFIAEFLEQL